ncbi:4-alpha-glucanotransferase [Herbivorax sp. ANBcel31]|uniref:4-alpha-glucanotransferase n=1 Tax=Herbivorax sp. ANBcel31 TaxID=3069754 RepID=UPI0027B8508D|nr:4-alpha-glucanotransferase [Herbivorax sp. ANBcel31]MDQ2086998.1 4-alpha-glucanotransferase [Herbivorax sp. ANBcel31]
MEKAYKKRSKVIVPVFAANSSSSFTRLNDVIKILLTVFPKEVFKEIDKSEVVLQNKNFDSHLRMVSLKTALNFLTKRDYAGNLEDLAYILHFLKDIGVTDVAELPFTQKHQSTASPFSSSSFGLELDYLVLELVPEVQEDDELLSMIPKRPVSYEKDLSCDFEIHREARKAILSRASRKFMNKILSDSQSERIKAYKKYVSKYDEKLERNAIFTIVQSKVLNTYMDSEPDFRTWPKKYQSPHSEDVKRLALLYAEEIDAYKYSQFCIHEQQLLIKKLYNELGLKREVNIAFGIDPSASGDVWALQGKAFNIEYELGTDNGQNWRIPPYNTKSKAYYELMNERIKYLSQYIDILFLDHMCGYATQYIMKKGVADDPGRYEIDPSNRAKKIKNVKKIIEIALKHGLEVGGETLGDAPRQSAVEEAIRKMKKSGHPIPEMYVAPHKSIGGQYDNHQKLPQNTELFLSTHDLPTIIQILCGKRGDIDLNDFRYPEHKIANFLSQQFGILTTPNQTPLNPEDITSQMGIAMMEIFMTSSAQTVTIPIQDIFALLFPQEVGIKEYFNINIAGTSCGIENENKNFSRILPPVQKFEPFKEQLRNIFNREQQPFDYPERLVEHGMFFTWIAYITPGRKLIYQNPKNKQWQLFKHRENGVPVLEMVISNLTDKKQIGTVELPKEFRKVIKSKKRYKLLDIAHSGLGEKSYYRIGKEMLEHIYIELLKETDHHFIVYELS